MDREPILEYLSASEHNRRIFFLNFPWAVRAYAAIHDGFDRIGLPLSERRDASGKSHVGLIPFVLLMQRQSMAAFWALAEHRSYQAWVLLRPCVEAFLVVGKWLDDVENAAIWRNRQPDKKTYIKTYQGAALTPAAFCRGEAVRSVLTRINDDFVHPNPEYYDRHTEAAPLDPNSIFLRVHYFDRDADEHEAALLAMLHLVIVLQEELAEALNAVLVGEPKIALPGDAFRTVYGPAASRLAKAHPNTRATLAELGLWDLDRYDPRVPEEPEE
jgi:hypothetical protein